MTAHRRGDMFEEVDFSQENVWLATTTNSVILGGRLVMGAGHAKQVLERNPGIDVQLARQIQRLRPSAQDHYGVVFWERIVAFQTKRDWRSYATLDIISNSCAKLKAFMDARPGLAEIHLPMPGIGLGGLRRSSVEELLGEYLFDDRLIIWTLEA